MIKNITLCLILVTFSIGITQAQDPTPANPGVTNASFGKIGKPGNTTESRQKGTDIVHVNLYTGIGNVSIPIYDYTVDGLDLGISLNYNTKGIKVDQVATSVGLGWDLSVGGEITRQVNGSEDEIVVPALDDNFCDLAPKVPAVCGAWCTLPGTVNQCGQGVDVKTYHHYVSEGNNHNFILAGYNHDVFTANFGGRTLKFTLYRNPNNPNNILTVHTYPKSEVKIDISINGNVIGGLLPEGQGLIPDDNSKIGFIITDEKGNVFYFNSGEYEYKRRTDPAVTTDTKPYFPTTKWVLTKIKTYKGNEVTYQYYDEEQLSEVIYPARRYQEVRERFPHSFMVKFPSIPAQGEDDGGIVVIDSVVYWRGRSNHIQSITYPNGTRAVFHLNTAADRCDIAGQKALASIDILAGYDNNTENKFTYKFNYAYFLAENNVSSDLDVSVTTPCNTINSYYGLAPDGTGVRLGLKSIDKIGLDNVNTERYYTFDYSSQRLPHRLSMSQDLYGYYNGFSPTGLYAPTLSPNPFYLGIPYHESYYVQNMFPGLPSTDSTFNIAYGVNKSQNVELAEACNLTKITNGLGGSIAINYSNGGSSIGFHLADNVYQYHTGPRPQDTVLSNGIDWDNLTGVEVHDGLCVSSIEYCDGYNKDNNTKTFYSYDNGERFYPGGYYWQNTIIPKGAWESNAYNSYLERTWYNNMLNPWNYPFGSNHGFKEVTVTQKNNLGEQISKSKYEFTGVENIFNSGSYNSNIKVATGWAWHLAGQKDMREEYMGLNTSVTQYDYDVPSHIISKTENKYTSSLHFSTVDTITNIFENPGTLSSYGFRYPCDGLGCTSELSSEGIGYAFAAFGPYTTSIFQYNKTMLSESKMTTFSNGQEMVNTMKYFYETTADPPVGGVYHHFDNLKRVEWTNSKNETFKKGYSYNYDFSFTAASKVQYPEASVIYKISNGDSALISMEWGKFLEGYEPGSNYNTGFHHFGLPDYASVLNLKEPMLFMNIPPGLHQVTSLNTRKLYTYDSKNNVIETRVADNAGLANELSEYSAMLWDHRLGVKIAEVNGAKHTQIAYSSFEGGFEPKGIVDENKGNFDFNTADIVLGSNNDKPVTGRYYYQLKANSTSQIESTNQLENGKEYLLTFWAKQSDFVIQKGTQTITSAFQNITTVNGWTLYAGKVMGNNNKIYLGASGGDIKIDELRLHPIDVSMMTSTYEPLLGVNSTCDERNNITYYEYDMQGRLSVVRDIDGNILSMTKVTNQGGNN
jgi:YD repeat-containing protein